MATLLLLRLAIVYLFLNKLSITVMFGPSLLTESTNSMILKLKSFWDTKQSLYYREAQILCPFLASATVIFCGLRRSMPERGILWVCRLNLQEIIVDVITSGFIDPLTNGHGSGEVQRCPSYWFQCPNADKVLV